MFATNGDTVNPVKNGIYEIPLKLLSPKINKKHNIGK